MTGSRGRRTRSMAPRLFIFTEGKSEVMYFSMFRRRGMPISVIPIQAGNTDILGITEYCLREPRLRGFGDVDGDRAAIVFDRDLNSLGSVDEARRKAGEVNLFMSNPSFEYWLILHFRDVTRAMTQDEMEELLGDILGHTYSKGADITRRFSASGIREAVGRAEMRLPRDSCTVEACYGTTPSTMLHVLVSELVDVSGM